MVVLAEQSDLQAVDQALPLVPRSAPHLVELLNWFLGLCTLWALGFLLFSSFGS